MNAFTLMRSFPQAVSCAAASAIWFFTLASAGAAVAGAALAALGQINGLQISPSNRPLPALELVEGQFFQRLVPLADAVRHHAAGELVSIPEAGMPFLVR